MDRRSFILTASTLVAAGFPGVASGKRRSLARAILLRGETDVEAFTAERRFIALPQGRIAYVDRGKGPAALFLHGFPLNGYQWRGALDRLSGMRRCIVPDVLGLGYTEPAQGQDMRAPAQAQMMIALLDRLGLGKVDLIANDSGCAVAQLILAHHGERVRTLLLTNGDTEPDCPPGAIEAVIKDAKAEKFADWFPPQIADKAFARRPDQLGGLTFTFPDRLSDETIDMYLKPLAANPARTNAYGRAAEGNPLAGISDKLRNARTPVRVLWGTGDTIFRPAMAEYLDKLFPNSRGVRRIEGAKLFFPEEFPDLIAEELRALWA